MLSLIHICLKVTATYANGVKRDVSHLMKAADKALTQADTSVTLIYGLGQTMYHNVENTDKTMKPGEETASKSISCLLYTSRWSVS